MHLTNWTDVIAAMPLKLTVALAGQHEYWTKPMRCPAASSKQCSINQVQIHFL